MTKPQYLKSMNTIGLQPTKITPRIMNIMYLDLGGRTTKEIAELVGLTEARVSLIKTSPLYTERRGLESEKLSSAVIEKQSDKLVHGDLVERTFEEKKQTLAQELLNLALNAESEQVRQGAIVDALGYIGYKPRVNSIITTVEVDARMQAGWDRVMKNDEYNKTERGSTVRIKTEVSE